MWALIYSTFVFIILTTLTKFYFKKTNKFCISDKRLDGRTCVVTGGTTGMGLEISKELARRGAKVIIACPFEQEGTDTQKIIVKETSNDKVFFKHLNLASLESTRKFAQELLESETRLDLLINNAGVGPESGMTEDGLSFTMQVNYYGHFLMTMLLLPLLNKTGTSTEKSRIVNTTSMFHFIGSFKPHTLNRINYWNSFFTYGNSKLCFLLFSTELAKRLNAHGYEVVTNTIDPGAVGTTIHSRSFGLVLGFLIQIYLYVLVKTPWEGAQTALHAALDEKAGEVSGKYFNNCELSRAKEVAYNDKVAKQLWDESVQLVKLDDKNILLN